MRLKKVLVGALVLSMLMTPCVSMASADDVTDMDSAKGEITGDGELEGYVKKEAFRMVLPTTATTKVGFTLDPQGLLHTTDDTIYTEDTTGWILFGDEKTSNSSKSIITKNKSSYPVQLDMEVAIGNMKTDNVRVKFVEKEADVSGKLEDGTTDDTALNMYLAAVPKKVKETDAGDADSSTTTFPVGASGKTNLSFVLDGYADNYEIGKKADGSGYEYKLKASPDDAQWDQVGFTLTGKVNKNADWSEFLAAQTAAGDAAEKMNVKISYTVSKYDGKYVDIPADSWVDKDGAHGVIIASKNVLKTNGKNDIIIEYKTPPTSVVVTPVTLDNPTGAKTPMTITKGTQWTAVDGILTIKKEYLIGVINSSGRGTGIYKVIVDGEEVMLTFEK